MPDNYYSEVNDHGNVIPIKDLAAVAWADAGKSVKKNKMVFDVQATSQNNVTLAINSDNTYTVNTGSGGVSELTTIRVGYITEAGQYRLNGCPEGGGDSTYRLDVRPNGSTTPMTGSVDTGTGSAVINVTSGDLPASVTMRIPSGATISNKLFKPMVRNADIVDDTFEKTIPDNTELMTWEANTKLGAKNIFKWYRGIGDTFTQNDVSYSVNSDYSVSVSGTASDNANYYLGSIEVDGVNDYILSGAVDDNHIFRLGIKANASDSWGTYYASVTDEMVIPHTVSAPYGISVNATVVKDGEGSVVYSPMYRLASDTDETYTEPTKTNIELSKEATLVESACTDIITGATVAEGQGGNHLVKRNNVVNMLLCLEGVTASSFGAIAKIPEGYRPKYTVITTSARNVQKSIYIGAEGNVVCSEALSNVNINISATWVVS